MEKTTIKERVHEILEDKENARNSDNICLYEYYKKYNPEILHVPLGAVLLRPVEHEFIPLETIPRMRRLVSNEYGLKGNKEVEVGREQEEKEFRSMALNGR